MTTPKLVAVRPWNFNREWRGEDKPIQHTAYCCQLYRETEKNSIRLFYSHTTYVPRCGVQKRHLVVEVKEACSPPNASLLLLTFVGAVLDEHVLVSNNKRCLEIDISVTWNRSMEVSMLLELGKTRTFVIVFCIMQNKMVAERKLGLAHHRY